MTAMESSQENVGKYLIIAVIKAIHIPNVVINALRFLHASKPLLLTIFTLSFLLAPYLNSGQRSPVKTKSDHVTPLYKTSHLPLS